MEPEVIICTVCTMYNYPDRENCRNCGNPLAPDAKKDYDPKHWQADPEILGPTKQTYSDL